MKKAVGLLAALLVMVSSVSAHAAENAKILGDANGDGYVNVNDVTAIQRHAAELELLEGINFHAADINGDGNVSVDDATELQRFLAEYVVDYPIGEVMTQ